MLHRLTSAVAVLALSAGTALAAPPDAIIVGMALEPPGLDPTAGAAAAIDEVTYANVFEGLTRFAPDGSVLPALAEKWEVSEGGRVYTFTLNHGVKFHDGTDFNAADVVFSFERARAESSTNAQKGLFANIEKIEAPEPFLVRITLRQPDGALPFNLAWGDAVIVAPESIETIATHPVGTGAFTFRNWVQGDRIDIARYEGYWGEAPALETASFRFISDPSAAFAAVMAEDIDVFVGFPAPENLIQFEADPRFQVLVGSTEGETILAINNAREPFDNVLVRQAVAHAIDRQAVIDGAMYGYGTPIGTHFAPHHPDYVDLTGISAHDPARARELLAEAGLPDGFTTTLKLPPPAYARRGGEIIAAQLRAVGIEAQIENQEWAQWLESTFGGGHDFGLTIISHTEPMDIGIYANPEYYFQYDNPDLQALMATLTSTTDPEARSALLAEAQTIIAENYVVGFLFQLPVPTVARAGIEGLWLNQPTAAIDLTGVSWP